MLIDVESKNIVFTSGVGFIGSNLVKKLVEKNNVIVVNNLLAHDVLKKINLEELTEIMNRTSIFIDDRGFFYYQVLTKLNNFLSKIIILIIR
jgi:nucleoside-diphosphate-sugar epimerase